jgi:hypothetical protein
MERAAQAIRIAWGIFQTRGGVDTPNLLHLKKLVTRKVRYLQQTPLEMDTPSNLYHLQTPIYPTMSSMSSAQNPCTRSISGS